MIIVYGLFEFDQTCFKWKAYFIVNSAASKANNIFCNVKSENVLLIWISLKLYTYSFVSVTKMHQPNLLFRLFDLTCKIPVSIHQKFFSGAV